jgi:hypothetical protein
VASFAIKPPNVGVGRRRNHETCHAGGVARAISVRLDDEALSALARLQATGLSRSAAIRSALVVAATRVRDRQALAAEVAAVEADEADRAEMREVVELMEQLCG